MADYGGVLRSHGVDSGTALPAGPLSTAVEPGDTGWVNLGNMAMNLGDDAAHRSAFATTLAAARTDGAVMDVLYALHRLFLSQYAAGDWAAMRRSSEEALSLARSIGQPAQTGTPLACLALLAALRRRDDYDELLAGATGTSRSPHTTANPSAPPKGSYSEPTTRSATCRPSTCSFTPAVQAPAD